MSVKFKKENVSLPVPIPWGAQFRLLLAGSLLFYPMKGSIFCLAFIYSTLNVHILNVKRSFFPRDPLLSHEALLFYPTQRSGVKRKRKFIQKNEGQMITKDEILSAQKAWGDALIEIGKLKDNRAECEAMTAEVIDRYYAFDLGNVLFKPTRASEIQFRGTREGAIAYFIGGSDSYPEDSGFALQPWTKIEFDNAGGMFIYEDYAVAMGNYLFTEAGSGAISKVEYTFGYIKDSKGALKINLHHSSVPFTP